MTYKHLRFFKRVAAGRFKPSALLPAHQKGRVLGRILMLNKLSHPVKRLQLFFALVAIALVLWGWMTRSSMDLKVVLSQVGSLAACVSMWVGTIRVSPSDNSVLKSKAWVFGMRIFIMLLALAIASNIYLFSLNLMKVRQARQDKGIPFYPVVEAIRKKDLDGLKVLLKAGWTISSRDQFDLSPLDYASGAMPVSADKPSGSVEIVDVLLKHGAGVNSFGIYRRTPLMHAVRSRNLELIKFLISRGAEVDRVSSDGHTALFYAQLDGNREVVQILKNAGARSIGLGEKKHSEPPP